MSQTTPDPTPAAQVTVTVPGMDPRTVSLDASQMFVYAPSITDTNDPRVRRALDRIARMVRPPLVNGVAPNVAPDNSVVVLPADPAAPTS